VMRIHPYANSNYIDAPREFYTDAFGLQSVTADPVLLPGAQRPARPALYTRTTSFRRVSCARVCMTVHLDCPRIHASGGNLQAPSPVDGIESWLHPDQGTCPALREGSDTGRSHGLIGP
jgi:hypothetical protein